MHIYKSPQEISIPQDVNLTELLHASAHSPPLPPSHEIATDTFEGRSVTLGELRQNAGGLAQGLSSHFQPADQSRWALLMPNGVTFIEAVHAILWQGGVFCPINHELRAGEIGYAFTVCKPAYAIVWSEVLPLVLEALKTSKEVDPEFNPPKIITVGSVDGYPSFDSFRSADSMEVPHHSDTRTRAASIHLSSGTTGKQKGVLLTHYNYVANVYQCHAHDPAHWSPPHTSLVYSPMVHIANTTVPLFLGPWGGTKHVIMPKLDIPRLCELVEKHRVVDMPLPPALVTALLTGELTKKYDLSSVKYLVGMGVQNQSVADRLLQLHDWTLVNLYGMTEAAPYVSWSKLGEMLPAGQVGSFVPNMEFRLCDGDGKDVPVGAKGELWLRGPNVTPGYIDNPVATAAAFKEGSWYNTGDVCTISPAGIMAIVGRTKELFKSSGFQVSPQELEHHLVGHPHVAEVAVGPVYDEAKQTDVAAAYVILKAHLNDKEDKVTALGHIQGFLDGKVSGYKRLKGGVWEVTQLPKNGTGKILRHLITEHKTGLVSAPKPKL
ncbi:hypothetical protein ASPZODRAFT_137306 [Penicilliopsis zonata CBS 506.65]|uniref:AMP-dependent synthetase/ligase domain-containing protein n=1 Tax=Penicilliopsis zonata CBS 506.65 TaxID=1073090 RepID=A0A1L9S5E5_9EURO|nr:hypothetical protein ASPZODRAFT_137306 [Penicilliopsis zonata CBS 506.65]OJJ42383.1 hypothetical protein ASPZODRAFT_137306 [Penicilliopsis zonata CBS 506.65]